MNLDAEEAAFGVVGDEGSDESDSEPEGTFTFQCNHFSLSLNLHETDSAPSRSPLKDPSKAKSPHRDESPVIRREEVSYSYNTLIAFMTNISASFSSALFYGKRLYQREVRIFFYPHKFHL